MLPKEQKIELVLRREEVYQELCELKPELDRIKAMYQELMNNYYLAKSEYEHLDRLIAEDCVVKVTNGHVQNRMTNEASRKNVVDIFSRLSPEDRAALLAQIEQHTQTET